MRVRRPDLIPLATLVLVTGLVGVWACAAPGVPLGGSGAMVGADSPPGIPPAERQDPAGPAGQTPEESRLTMAELTQGVGDRKVIALTFDDGPQDRFTARLLDILAQERAVATFFLVGRMVKHHPDLVRRMVAEGHQLANHSYTHRNLAKLPPDVVRAELSQTNDAIAKVVGFRPRMFRPPGGQFTGETREAATEIGMINVLWTSNPGDFRYPSAKELEDRIVQEAVPGGIVLLHSGIPETMNALPGAIRRLREAGYTFVTCTQIAEGVAAPPATITSP